MTVSPHLLLEINSEGKSNAVENSISINGFDLSEAMFQNRLGSSYSWLSEKTEINRARLIHPYYLKKKNAISMKYKFRPGSVEADDKGPWPVGLALAKTSADNLFYPGSASEIKMAPPVANTKDTKEHVFLFEFDGEAGLPEWSWTKAPALQKTEENKKSLYKEFEKFHAALSNPAQAETLMASVLKSTKEFQQASNLHRKSEPFIESFFKAARTTAESKTNLKGWVFKLEPMDPKRSDLFLFADGKLATLNQRITLTGSRAPSPKKEYTGSLPKTGNNESQGEASKVNFITSLWFRKNAQNQWELDAMYPVSGDDNGDYY